VYGDGLQMRDWLHVDDHCAAISTILHADLPPIGPEAATDPGRLPIFDISARHEVTNLAIVDAVLRLLDLEPNEWIEHVVDRPNHDRRYLIEPAKIEDELGWSPTVDFTDGLAGTVRWYVDNETWWQDLLQRKGDLQQTW